MKIGWEAWTAVPSFGDWAGLVPLGLRPAHNGDRPRFGAPQPGLFNEESTRYAGIFERDLSSGCSRRDRSTRNQQLARAFSKESPSLAGQARRIGLGHPLGRDPGVKGGRRWGHFSGTTFRRTVTRLSLLSDHFGTVLALKGSLRRAQQRRAPDYSGPFQRKAFLTRGKGSSERLRRRDRFAAKMAPFFAAIDTRADKSIPDHRSGEGGSGRR